MKKNFILFIIFLSNISFVNANARYIGYEEFVHLSYPKQVETIKLVHEFLSEFEHQLIYGKNNKKYQSYMKILDFFINSAHADDTEFFSKIPSDLKCYYGGWISFMKNGKCVHPKRITYKENQDYLAKQAGLSSSSERSFKSSPIYQYYVKNISNKYRSYYGGQKAKSTPTYNILADNSGNIELKAGSNNCSSGSSIPCNPDIYGKYKGATLCLKTKNDYGVNASYLCNKAVEKIKETDIDEYQNLMNGIINNGISGNGELFTALKTMYDTCLCGGDAQESIAKDYAHRIFQTRTCAGIIAQTQLINNAYRANACREDSNEFASGINLEWMQFLNKAANKSIQANIDIIRSKTPLDLENTSFTPHRVRQLMQEDQKLFSELAYKNFEIAKANKLCLNKGIKPAITASFNPKTNILTVKTQGEDFSITSIDSSLKVETVNGDEENIAKYERNESQPENSREFTVTRANTLTYAKATATHNGMPLESNTVEIPGIKTKDNKLAFQSKEYILIENKIFNITDLTLDLSENEETLTNIKIPFKNLSLAPKLSLLQNEASKENYIVETPTEEKEVKAIYKADQTEIKSNTVKIGPPQIACSIKEDKNEEGISTISFIPKFKDDITLDIDLSDSKLVSELAVKYNNKSLKPKEEATNAVEIKDYDSSKNISATAKIKVANLNLKMECGEEKKDDSSKFEDIAKCEIKIDPKKQEDGQIKLNHKLTLFDKDGKEIKTPKDYKYEVNWYDTNKKPAEEKESKKMSSSKKVAKKAKKKEETKKEEIDDEIAKLPEKYFTFKNKDNSNLVSISLLKQNKTRKIIAVAKGKGCRAQNSYTMDPKTNQLQNNKPNYLQNTSGGLAPLKGGINRGVD